VKLGENASDICVVFSEDHGGEAMKKWGVFEWYKPFKEGRMSKSQMKTMLITFFNIKSIVHYDLFQKASQSTKHIVWKYRSGYVKLCVD
jgi:uncharacterized protein YktA (UPF0223 family)